MDSSTIAASHSVSQPDTPVGASSSDPKGSASAVHKRTYQACLPCRRRKVRCDLGSVDEPGDPPCLRCRREKKDCIFSETRRKRKAEEDGELSPDFIARNKRSSIGLGGSGGENGAIGDIHVDELGNLDDRGLDSIGDDNDDSIMNDAGNEVDGGSGSHGGSRREGRHAANRSVANETAAALFRQPITQPNDALRMLVDAASHTELEGRNAAAAAAAAVTGNGNDLASSGSGTRHGSTGGAPKTRTASMTAPGGSGSGIPGTGQADNSSAIDPQIMAMQEAAISGVTADNDQAINDELLALQAWTSLRFVQAGWFTAREAMEYIDFFYKHLAPLTPVRPPDYSSRAAHPTLLNDDPMLTVTLMTIVSRYKELKGPGSKARSFRIHDKLWEYLQGMITRMFWGQEQFGGGFCGAGNGRTAMDLESSRRGLRSLGTVESLLLLSDWLPRSMHFPPGDDANELTAPLPPMDPFDIVEESRKPNASWIEPAIRSDRMCWSLVGMAYTLSWELGVFDSLVESGRWSPGPQEKTWYDPERADRIGRMLLVYVSQTCGRLGYPNMMPSQGNETNYNFLKMDVPAGTFPGPYPTITAEDKLQRAWAELTALMRQSNTEMFDSKSRTRDSIQSGEYLKFLESWGPRLRDWKGKFEKTEIEPRARTMLLIEYEYTRTYINSVALQAVVESCADGGDGTSPANLHSSHTPPALFSSKLIDVHKQNRKYIDELVEAARNVLRLAVGELQAFKALTHVPVRTHFRILSAAMFLLKSFALGAKESEVHTSMTLLDKTVNALKKWVIDDVHLSLRIAELLKSLTSSIRKRFVRLAVPSRGTKRTGQASRPSTSAPKTSSSMTAQQSSEHRPSTGQGRPHSVHQNGNGQGFSPDSSFHLGPGHSDDFYPIFGDSAPPLVDLKDSSITIMPPPDFLGALPSADTYPPTSPHSSTSPTGGRHSPGSAAAAAAQKQHRRSMSQAQAPFSPTAGAQMPPFSPLSANSGSYEWWALDFNPLLNQGNIFHNTHGHSPGATHQQHGSHGQVKREHETADHNDGDGDVNRDGTGNLNPWAAGAFGPEISEGLEMLGALGALGYEEGLGGPPGQSGPGW